MKEVVGGGNLTQAQLRTHIPLNVSSLVSDPAALIHTKRTYVNRHGLYSGNIELLLWTLLNIYNPPRLVNVWHCIYSVDRPVCSYCGLYSVKERRESSFNRSNICSKSKNEAVYIYPPSSGPSRSTIIYSPQAQNGVLIFHIKAFH